MFLRSLNTDPEIKISNLPSKLQCVFPYVLSKRNRYQADWINRANYTHNRYKWIPIDKRVRKTQSHQPEMINNFAVFHFKKKKKFWTSTTNCFIICINSLGKKVKEIATKSGEMPCDISMSCDGDLLYRDWTQKTVNKIVNGQIKDMNRLEKWKPTNICAISPYDILVVMRNDDNTQSKVVRFSGDEEKQTIQFDENGKPLYSGNDEIKYIAVNKKKIYAWLTGKLVQWLY